MTKPALKVEIAFTSNPLAVTPTWVDVTADVRERVSIRRGRQTERDRIEAGTATLTLDNRTRKYDPNNSSGPYAGNILPMRPIRISAVSAGVTYRLFRGYIAAWPPVEPGGRDALVQLSCVDGFAYFSLAPLALTRGQELGSARITAILDSLGWPAGDRVISTAQSTLQAINPAIEASSLSHLQDVAASENGLLFMDAQGRVVFQDRHLRLKNSSVATFGNAGGVELPFKDIAIGFDASQIWNEIKLSYNNGTTVTASDATSQLKFFRRTLPASRPYILTSTEAQDHASWLLLRYANPDIRIDRLVINGHLSDSLWPHMFGRELSDRITVIHRPPGGGPAVQRDAYIEAALHEIGDLGATWTTTWSLSPATNLSFLTFDDPILGRFDFSAFAY